MNCNLCTINFNFLKYEIWWVWKILQLHSSYCIQNKQLFPSSQKFLLCLFSINLLSTLPGPENHGFTFCAFLECHINCNHKYALIKCVASFSQHNILTYSNSLFFFFSPLVLFHFMDMLQFGPLQVGWHLDCFQFGNYK